MAMNQEQFETLIHRLEEFSRRQPGSYRLRVGFLAALGYSYILLVLAVLLALLIGGILLMLHAHRFNAWLIKILFLLGVFAFLIARALWVQFPRPEGIEIQRQEAPRLFAMMDEMIAALKAPRFHHVMLDHDFNCAVLQRPRLGVLGWQENYLLLGLPFMQALPPEQFRAVVAHELGHLSGNHSRFSAWIYRVRQTWAQLLTNLEENNHSGAVIFEPFLNWYVPFFNAYSFVLARADEYVADRCAAELAGASTAAQALINTQVKGAFLENNFWPEVYKRVDVESDPPPAVFSTMFHSLRSAAQPTESAVWIATALKEKTDYADTHPSLADRLAALGHPLAAGGEADTASVALAEPMPETAAQHYLGDALAALTERLDLTWKEAIAPHWSERHAYAQESRRALQELEEKAQTGPLTDEETWDRAKWTAEFKGNQAAIPLLREIVAARADDVAAHYALGQLLLEEEDTAGIDHLEKAIAGDPHMVLDGLGLIYGFLHQQGREAEAERYRERAEAHLELLQQAGEERSYVSAGDKFEPHGLAPDEVERLREFLSQQPEVKEAYLVRKVVTHLAAEPFYVLAVTAKYGFWTMDSTEKNKELVNRLSAYKFHGDAAVIILNEHYKKVRKAIPQVAGAQVYRRP